MSVVDEIRVTDDGTVEIRIIPPDHVSEDLEIMGVYPPGSWAREVIIDICARTAARTLGIACDITGVVHGGEDRYTFITSAGDYVESNAGSQDAIAAAMAKVARVVESLELVRHNHLPTAVRSQRERPHPVRANRLVRKDHALQRRSVRVFSVPNPSGYLPGELNPFPSKWRDSGLRRRRPNSLRRAQ